MWDDGAAVDAHHAWSMGGAGGLFLILVLFALTAAAAAMIGPTALTFLIQNINLCAKRKVVISDVLFWLYITCTGNLRILMVFRDGNLRTGSRGAVLNFRI